MGNSKSKGGKCLKRSSSAPSQNDNESANTINTSNSSKSNTSNLPNMAPNNNCIRLREIPDEFLNLVPNELINSENDDNKEQDDKENGDE